MRRPLAAVAAALALLATAAAAAHKGNPNFRSTITALTPATPGVSLDILSLDDRIELTNRSAQTVTVDGYNDEPYLRILPDGTVELNRMSPATYLNEDRFGAVKTPAFASADAPPQWQVVDRTGRYEWHDHRIHYMAKGTPPQVKDTSKRTKVFDWKVPVSVGARPGAINGSSSGSPRTTRARRSAAIVGLVALVLLGGGAVLLARRRRRAAAAEDGEPREAW